MVSGVWEKFVYFAWWLWIPYSYFSLSIASSRILYLYSTNTSIFYSSRDSILFNSTYLRKETSSSTPYSGDGALPTHF
jgi:hypothetical protein